jgi:hypothetical protein
MSFFASFVRILCVAENRHGRHAGAGVLQAALSASDRCDYEI